MNCQTSLCSPPKIQAGPAHFANLEAVKAPQMNAKIATSAIETPGDAPGRFRLLACVEAARDSQNSLAIPPITAIHA